MQAARGPSHRLGHHDRLVDRFGRGFVFAGLFATLFLGYRDSDMVDCTAEELETAYRKVAELK